MPALVPIVTTSIPNWEFTPVRPSDAETNVKYFCFRVQTVEDPAQAGGSKSKRAI